jgi:hypothetical protein
VRDANHRRDFRRTVRDRRSTAWFHQHSHQHLIGDRYDGDGGVRRSSPRDSFGTIHYISADPYWLQQYCRSHWHLCGGARQLPEWEQISTAASMPGPACIAASGVTNPPPPIAEHAAGLFLLAGLSLITVGGDKPLAFALGVNDGRSYPSSLNHNHRTFKFWQALLRGRSLSAGGGCADNVRTP